MNIIGNKIRDLRILSGLSQEELGNRLGVKRAAINKYEKGVVTNIPISTVEKMAEVFDVNPGHIVGWIGSASTDTLSLEVKIINGVSKSFGKEAVDALEGFVNLNAKGKKRVLQYIEDLASSEEFRD